MPNLADNDIEALVDVLTRENRLGKLKAKPRAEQERALREKCGRQLIVAMIEATSGEKFEVKVIDEWRELPPEGQELYATIAVATMLKFGLSREDLLLTSGATNNATLNAIDALTRRHIVTDARSDGRIRARHRVIAECLVDELRKQGNVLANVYANLAYVAACQISPNEERTTKVWRFLRALINHDPLLRVIGVDGARVVYEAVETLLSWDYHYWLHRGSLEVEEGDIRLAENFLQQAKALEPDDAFVNTEFAYMLLRKAIVSPTSLSSAEHVREGVAILRAQVANRGRLDTYPFHVLGTQGLAWSRRGQMARNERKTFLKGILRDLEQGAKLHPRSKDIAEILRDVQAELLSIELEPIP